MSGNDTPLIAWFNGDYLPHSDISISPLDRGFLFGDALYEVLRAYRGNFLRLEKHIRRLEAGAREVRFSRTDFSELEEVSRELIRRNGLTEGSATVYIQITRGVAPRGHGFPAADTPLTCYVAANPIESDHEAQREGIKTILVPDQRWVRRDIKSTNRLANVLASQQARDAGAKEALFVQDGAVLEGTHSSFFAVIGDRLVTHPQTPRVLPGTTVEIIREHLAGPLGLSVQERAIRESELAEIDEAFVTGTITEITPVVRVGRLEIGGGRPGAVTRKLQEAFREYVWNLPDGGE